MATKNYFISMKNPRLDSGVDESSYDPSSYPSQLTGVGATVDTVTLL